MFRQKCCLSVTVRRYFCKIIAHRRCVWVIHQSGAISETVLVSFPAIRSYLFCMFRRNYSLLENSLFPYSFDSCPRIFVSHSLTFFHLTLLFYTKVAFVLTRPRPQCFPLRDRSYCYLFDFGGIASPFPPTIVVVNASRATMIHFVVETLQSKLFARAVLMMAMLMIPCLSRRIICFQALLSCYQVASNHVAKRLSDEGVRLEGGHVAAANKT